MEKLNDAYTFWETMKHLLWMTSAFKGENFEQIISLKSGISNKVVCTLFPCAMGSLRTWSIQPTGTRFLCHLDTSET